MIYSATNRPPGEAFEVDLGAIFGKAPYRSTVAVQPPPGGLVLATEVVARKSKITKRDSDECGLPRTVYAWRISVVTQPNGAPFAMVEAMTQDHGRSPDGEILAHFKELRGHDLESLHYIAPPIYRKLMALWKLHGRSKLQ